jgi:hypothetical protein
VRHVLHALLVCLPLVLTACGCCEDEAQKEPETTKLPTEIDWQQTDPSAFLDLLVEHPGAAYSVTSPPPADWISADDVEVLMRRIDSDEPAALVCSALSSYLPRGETSTEGREALFLIEGLREGSYPPRLCSVHYFEPDLDEVRTWWQERRGLGY